MISRQLIKLTVRFLLATAAGATFIACGRSNGQNNSIASASPTASVIEVSTTAAISRQLPRFFEATGSLAADVQTDVQPQTAGKIVAVGVDMGTAVKKGPSSITLRPP